jgi:hypothetical protein
MFMYVLCLYCSVFACIGIYYNYIFGKMAHYKNTYWFVFACITMYCYVFGLCLYVACVYIACIQSTMH